MNQTEENFRSCVQLLTVFELTFPDRREQRITKDRKRKEKIRGNNLGQKIVKKEKQKTI